MRRSVPIAVVLLVVVSGCAGLTGGDQTPADPTGQTSTPTVTETPSVTATATSIAPEDATSENTVAFDALTATQREAFDEAVDGAARFAPESSYINNSGGYTLDALEAFTGTKYATYEGQYYQIDLSPGQIYMAHRITATAESPAGNATVHEFESLPSLTQDAVQPAIERGSYTTPYGMLGDSPPQPVDVGEYVSYRNETYQMSYSVLDSQAKTMTAQSVE